MLGYTIEGWRSIPSKLSRLLLSCSWTTISVSLASRPSSHDQLWLRSRVAFPDQRGWGIGGLKCLASLGVGSFCVRMSVANMKRHPKSNKDLSRSLSLARIRVRPRGSKAKFRSFRCFFCFSLLCRSKLEKMMLRDVPLWSLFLAELIPQQKDTRTKCQAFAHDSFIFCRFSA